MSGPLTHYLFQFLEAIVPRQTKLPNLRKVVIDRLFFAPPYLLALFYTVALLEVSVHPTHIDSPYAAPSNHLPQTRCIEPDLPCIQI